jgi:hypothetical protein
MSIGDIESNERGSGARFNDNKPAMELIHSISLQSITFILGGTIGRQWLWRNLVSFNHDAAI